MSSSLSPLIINVRIIIFEGEQFNLIIMWVKLGSLDPPLSGNGKSPFFLGSPSACSSWWIDAGAPGGERIGRPPLNTRGSSPSVSGGQRMKDLDRQDGPNTSVVQRQNVVFLRISTLFRFQVVELLCRLNREFGG